MMRQAVFQTPARRLRKGFTLIEAAIVTVIVGIGIVAMLQLLASGTMANTESTELTTAINLAGNIHEMSLSVPYKNIMTLDGRSFTPPIDGQIKFNTASPPAVTSYGNAISTLTGWQQVITVNYVDHNKITLIVPKTQLEPTARISVTVSHGTRPVYTTSWLVSAAEWPLP